MLHAQWCAVKGTDLLIVLSMFSVLSIPLNAHTHIHTLGTTVWQTIIMKRPSKQPSKRTGIAKRQVNCLVCPSLFLSLSVCERTDLPPPNSLCSAGPLHGLPVSVKDSVDLLGTDRTNGLTKNCFHPADDDAVLIQLIREAGG